jgi:hypothetical protein
MTLAVITVAVLAAGIGAWTMLAHVAVEPEIVSTVSTGDPAVAKISPLEIMKERGKDLPTTKNGDPF